MNDRARFLEKFDTLVNDIVGFLPKSVGSVETYVRSMCHYTVPDGKLNRGLTVISALRDLKGDSFSDRDFERACVVGWAIEWLQASFLVADDIVDRSELRRGKPCWYKKVGLAGLNDAFYLESCVYLLLEKHFSSEDSDLGLHLRLHSLFHSVTNVTIVGQMLDLQTLGSSLESESHEKAKKYSVKYNWDVYRQIVVNKTAYYSFYLPIAAAMLLNGYSRSRNMLFIQDNTTDLDLDMFDRVLKVLIPIGALFQAQDDFLDVYGDSDTTGKIGTDIQDGKCSWLICKAFDLAETGNEAEKDKLDLCYGSDDKDAINTVLEAYSKLGVESAFREYETKCFMEIDQLISDLKSSGDQGASVAVAIMRLIDKIRNRDK